MIQDAADDALETNATNNDGRVSEVGSVAGLGLVDVARHSSDSVGHRPRSFVDFLGQREDDAPLPKAADLHESPAQRTLARVRSDERDMWI